MQKDQAITASMKRDLSDRGWYFSTKEGRYIAFIGGDMNKTLISAANVRGLIGNIVKYEKNTGVNCYHLFFDCVPEKMLKELEVLCKSVLNENTSLIKIETFESAKFGCDMYEFHFRYHQISNDCKKIIEIISEKKIFSLVELSKSTIV